MPPGSSSPRQLVAFGLERIDPEEDIRLYGIEAADRILPALPRLSWQSPARKTMGTVEVFYSYSHKDETLRDELDKHLSLLRCQGVIRDWHDRRITGGQDWGVAWSTQSRSSRSNSASKRLGQRLRKPRQVLLDHKNGSISTAEIGELIDGVNRIDASRSARALTTLRAASASAKLAGKKVSPPGSGLTH